MPTILVPTDGSTNAEAALDVALDLAEKHGGQIKLLHVLLRDKEPFELLRLPALATAADDVAATLRTLARGPVTPRSASDILAHPNRPERPVPEPVLRAIATRVLNLASRRAESRGIAAEVLAIADGPAAAAIVATARREGIETIVMGTRGLRQIESVAFGSVSQEICLTAPCTCIAVHPGPTPATRPLAQSKA
jgi:nucleotide-binding universal stress UspA family protein